MGHTIIKPVADEDFYVAYSSIVDSPVFWGSREEFEKGYDIKEEGRLERADSNGTSSHIGEFEWAEKDIIVREGVSGGVPDGKVWLIVPRDRLREFCETLGKDGFFHVRKDQFEWQSEEDLM